ncbi:TBC domain protein [Gregarina niphandrodes]|uniref:TBC domain protein n=1 Tax=Gregarina niphandrodes TaxID=110365 RepID=A0A023B4U3_GRENI|nr:TBC domain protein [Gregarina niphandrodes]EZG57275.1 TBC domain protein [Gregarina niphandrodes]|eukprot:XP_011131059.1 TBC domain protein [Gregarina niphandrodes]
MSLVLRPTFWEEEEKSLILIRNHGYVTKDNAEKRCDEFRVLLELIPEEFTAEDTMPEKASMTREEAHRIFLEDAKRTFASVVSQKIEVACMEKVYEQLGDYHQGLCFIVSFLLLFLEPDEVLKICHYLSHTSSNGYYKIENPFYLRDARVFEYLLLNLRQPLGSLLRKRTVVPGQYLSKWFIGLGLHVLNFSAIYLYLRLLLCKPDRVTHFQVALSLIDNVTPELLQSKNVSETIEILKLDKSKFPNNSTRRTIHSKNQSEDEETPEPSPTNQMTKQVDMDEVNVISIFDKIIMDAEHIYFDPEMVQQFTNKVENEMAVEEKRRLEFLAAQADDTDEIVFSDEEEE